MPVQASVLRSRVALLGLAGLIAGAALWYTSPGAEVKSAAVPTSQAPAAQAPASVPLDAPLPMDPAVTTGRFENGLRYYIRANKQPLGRAELRLVVNAGSVLEEDDQRGLAHFVEHMAFNGTKHFPKQEISSFLQSLGMRFGPSVNASTTFDETIYALQIPTDKPAVVDRSLLILEDWAQNVTFDPAEVDKERGVVIEEWRMRRGAAARMQEAQFPLLFKGSRYADRPPIGTVENLQKFDIARLKAFYSTWYRPDLMGVIAVGDFDLRAMQELIRKHFAAIPAARAARPRPSFPLPPQPGTQYNVVTDKEAPGAAVTVYANRAAGSDSTVGDYRRQIIDRLAAIMLSTRLSEIAQRPNAPVLSATATRGRLVRTVDSAMVSAALREDVIERGLVALFSEVERVARAGFTPEELERQKTTLLRGFELAVAQRDTRPSAQFAAEYTRSVTRDEPFPGLAYESDLMRRFVPAITLTEVNAAAKAWSPADNRAVLVNAPEKPGVTVPDAARFAAALKAVASATFPAYVARADNLPLLDAKPVGGSIVRTTTVASLGLTEWELSNGLKVVVKPTKFKEDEVLFGATSSGGTSLASDADLVPAQTAVQVVTSLGFGKFASADLRRMLTGKVASVRPLIGLYEEGLAGSASQKDLETLFQLIYLTMTQPRRDPVIFNSLQSSMRSAFANQSANPEFGFGVALASALTQDHPRARLLTRETVDAMDMDRSLAFYKARFGDASRFRFIFAGSVDPEALKPLVEQYLAGLPSAHRQESWRDVGVRFPATIVDRKVQRGTEPRSRVAIVFGGAMPYDPAHTTALRAMAEVLQTRLRETLREALGGTYVVTATATAVTRPREEYTVSIGFGSDPARVEALTARVFEEIARLKADGPTAQELANVKAALLRDFETGSRQNAFVLTQLLQRYERGESPETLLQVPESYKQVTAAAVRDAARTYLDANRYVKVTLLPEKATAPAR